MRRPQPANIKAMLTTFPVAKLDSSSASTDAQPRNMPAMSSTRAVSKPDRSSVSRELQPSNIRLMLVTRDVSSFARSQKVMRSNPSNHSLVDSGAIPSSTTSTILTSPAYTSQSRSTNALTENTASAARASNRPPASGTLSRL